MKLVVDLKSMVLLGGTEIDYVEQNCRAGVQVQQSERQAQLRLRRELLRLRGYDMSATCRNWW